MKKSSLQLWLVSDSSFDGVTVVHKDSVLKLKLQAGEQKLDKYSDLLYEV